MLARLRDPLGRRRRAAHLDALVITSVGRASASAIPKQFGPGRRSEPCPRCDAAPVGGWLWFSDANTWDERLNMLLRCANGHPWAMSTDMN